MSRSVGVTSSQPLSTAGCSRQLHLMAADLLLLDTADEVIE